MNIIKNIIISTMTLSLLLLTACGCNHEWINATCTKPQTCSICGETTGEPIEHSWIEATCTKPQTCSICGETTGEPIEHSWIEATYFSPKTCSICNKREGTAILPTSDWYDITRPLSATPRTLISEGVCFAVQEIATYNSSESKYILVNKKGEIIKETNVIGDTNVKLKDKVNFDAQMIYSEIIGEFSFFKIYEGNDEVFYVFDTEGNIVDTLNILPSVEIIHPIANIGDGYYLFAIRGKSYNFYILTPEGKCINLPFSRDYKYIIDLPNMEKYIEVGNISENTFSLIQRDYVGVCALYYDINGNILVDLSKDKTNFEVKTLGEFNNGKANIRFLGADYNWYNATIDIKGNFVEEPLKE